MAFTPGELENIANAALDWLIRGPAFANTIQNRPLYDGLRRAQRNFPGGKGEISEPVKGDWTTTVQGYTHNDTVTYANPANIKRANYPWKEIHGGITVTLTELKIDGISVVDSLNSRETRDHSQVELTRLTGLLDDKMGDLVEGFARSFQDMLWMDGTQDPLEVPGVKSIIVDRPDITVVGGLDPATETWWQNRALVDATGSGGANNSITVDPTNGGALLQTIQKEYRQLRRYGGRPNLWLAGSDFIDGMELELRANGNYTDNGFSRRSATEGSMAEVFFKGNQILYDPHLDDLGEAKRMYVMDTSHIYLQTMEGEDMKRHTPARPSDQYVMYRALTWTGGLVARQRNSLGVYEIA